MADARHRRFLMRRQLLAALPVAALGLSATTTTAAIAVLRHTRLFGFKADAPEAGRREQMAAFDRLATWRGVESAYLFPTLPGAGTLGGYDWMLSVDVTAAQAPALRARLDGIQRRLDPYLRETIIADCQGPFAWPVGSRAKLGYRHVNMFTYKPAVAPDISRSLVQRMRDNVSGSPGISRHFIGENLAVPAGGEATWLAILDFASEADYQEWAKVFSGKQRAENAVAVARPAPKVVLNCAM